MTNAKITAAFLNSTDLKTKNFILANIANYYGITTNEAFQEITDSEAESLMDYITGPTRLAVSLFYNKFIMYL